MAHFFLKKFNAETGRRINDFSKEVKEQMMRYRWPGNVRELRNVVERAVVLASGTDIEIDELLLSNLATASESQMDMRGVVKRYVPESLADIERRHIAETLRATDWNKSRASQILGIERSTLDRKIKKHGITKGD